MNHQEQHHEHHRKEREEKKHAQHVHEREKKFLPFHPGWLLVAGAVLTVVALLVWTFI